MNIFILDLDPKTCAQYHSDKHLIKMILESFQMLCTAHRVIDGSTVNKKYVHPYLDHILYKATHVNHPCSVWTRSSYDNYAWLVSLAQELCSEYTHRYNKVHLSYKKLFEYVKAPPLLIDRNGYTAFAQAMPEQYKAKSAVDAYRAYYIQEKKSFAKYTRREMPVWLNGETNAI